MFIEIGEIKKSWSKNMDSDGDRDLNPVAFHEKILNKELICPLMEPLGIQLV